MMRKLFYIVAPSVLLFAAGCSSLPGKSSKKEPVVTKSAGLSEQNLEIGECAVFLWAASGKREFIYFQKQDSGNAKFYRDDTTVELSTRDNTSQLADTSSLNFNYVGKNGEKVVVTGGYGGEIEGGLKISPATIKLETKDGWEQITPASGVFACL